MKRKNLWMLCFIFMFLLSACGKSADMTENQIPDEYAVSVIVTINPQIKLYADINQLIVGVEYLNEDAKTAFSQIDFIGITMEEGMHQIVDAAIKQHFLMDGKDVDIEVVEIIDESCDGSAVCKKIEDAAAAALEKSGVTASVSARVSVEIVEEADESEAADSEETNVHEIEIPENALTETGATEDAMKELSETDTDVGTKETAQTEVSENVTPVIQNSAKSSCTVCGGTGKCDECKGDGYRGSGYTVSCPRCHGSLTETCIYCDANGNSTKHEGTCDFPNCMGAHVYRCTICGGGTIPVTCQSCGGSGKCNVCGGGGTQ